MYCFFKYVYIYIYVFSVDIFEKSNAIIYGKETIKRWHHKQCLLQSWNGLRFNQWNPQESEGTRPDHQQGGRGKLYEETTQQTD